MDQHLEEKEREKREGAGGKSLLTSGMTCSFFVPVLQPGRSKKPKLTEEEELEREARRQANTERRKVLMQKKLEEERRAVVEKLVKQQEHSKSVRAEDSQRVGANFECPKEPHWQL